jgi:succinate dehydrogenase / fumarate reductase cytochrome b subunit
VALYVFSMGALAFHLWHGFGSAFQTLGLNHAKYTPIINFVGRAFAIIVPALFALIPVWMFFS